MNEENKNIYISYWLLLITYLVGLIIIVGGLTRLTDSGLSITRWDIFTGIIPPLTSSNWEHAFSLYKKIPEFSLVNPLMTINEFKTIYWWEYIHRLLGRLIGIIYIIPLVYFTFKEKINKRTILSFYSIFILICIQGFLGWYMVKSGLTDRVDVSHFRLSIHLTVAFIILISVYWNYLTFSNDNFLSSKKKLPLKLTEMFLFLLIIQISLGALVSGLDAGQIYQTWPLMNQSYFPDDSTFHDLISLESFSTPSLVQFIHRNLAYLIIVIFLIIAYLIFKNNIFFSLRKPIKIIFIFLSIQVILGIFTVLSGAHIVLASMHQIGSIFLIISSVFLVYKNYRIN